MMPLMFANPGDEVIIKKVGGSAETKKHLEDLGFVVGGMLTVVKRNPYCHYERNGRKNYDIKRRNWSMATLKDAKIGQTVRVKKLTGEGAVKRRIMDMGITKGVEVYIRKVAPLGDPIEITVRGYELSLRKADAELIEVE